MKHSPFYKNFLFLQFQFSTFHSVDNRAGAPMNYLAMMLRGEGEIVSEQKTLRLKEGDVFIIPKGLAYQSYWRGEQIQFYSYGFHSLYSDEPLHFRLQTLPCDAPTKAAIAAIFGSNGAVDCRSLAQFYDAMAKVLPLLEQDRSNEQQMVEKIKAAIRKNPHHSLEEIATVCSISEPYIYALFKKHTDTTPNNFRQQVLCQAAVDLLQTTNQPIEQISSKLNFSSSSYFRKVLKKHTGQTPREIRKKCGF